MFVGGGMGPIVEHYNYGGNVGPVTTHSHKHFNVPRTGPITLKSKIAKP
jgi:hypothetical protein